MTEELSFSKFLMHNFIYDTDHLTLSTHIWYTQILKIEQVPTTSPAKEKRSARPSKSGYLDDVFLIFKARQHPFVPAEESALRWMGLRVTPEEVNIIFHLFYIFLDIYKPRTLDLLIRSSEMEVIKTDQLATDLYELMDQNFDLHLL
jgi:hypothetical protein